METIQEFRKRKRLECREYIWSVKNKGVCNHCGEDHPATLTFHHVNPEDKKYNISAMARQLLGIETVQEEINKCVLLCSNCHNKLHYEEKVPNEEQS